MQNLWSEQQASQFEDDLDLRVYTSRLLGKEENLVMHGGGNTSVKISQNNFFGEKEELLYVKGSGWDLISIEKPGFAPVKMDALLKMSNLEQLSDLDMVEQQRAAMTNPSAPTPSVEAILHAIIPFKFVDHTHADAVVAISNTKNGNEEIKKVYGDRLIIIPYVMPGFILAKCIKDLTKDINWHDYEGMILMNHGIFTFSDSAKESYELMIKLVSEAETHIEKARAYDTLSSKEEEPDLLQLIQIRKEVSILRGRPSLASLDQSQKACGYSSIDNVSAHSKRGTLTPDHVIRIKPFPLIIDGDPKKNLHEYKNQYMEYFNKNSDGSQKALDCAPRWGVWPGKGLISFGQTKKECSIISDIIKHNTQAMQISDQLSGWQTISQNELFEVEYWSLEQAKLGKSSSQPELQGKVAVILGNQIELVSAIAHSLSNKGAAVAVVSSSQDLVSAIIESGFLAFECDIQNGQEVKQSIEKMLIQFGGLDIVVNLNKLLAESQIDSLLPYIQEGINPCLIDIKSNSTHEGISFSENSAPSNKISYAGIRHSLLSYSENNLKEKTEQLGSLVAYIAIQPEVDDAQVITQLKTSND
ncbi:MAG: SDR family NAD(P)-dependent oxidoreductase [Planctomycetes bacterium]|nr:SDR family NAD(P)-dependent oxidoreductase [Planctomycetota bacterium]